jgi:hypothetical protein
MTGQALALDSIRRLPFVRKLALRADPRARDRGLDGEIEIETKSRKFRLAVETKRFHVSLAAAASIIAWTKQMRSERQRDVIVFAHFVPRRSAEALIAGRINFADEAGNLHLQLGDRYSWTSIGNPSPPPISGRRPITPAQLQLLFTLVTYPESVHWPVRKLEPASGVSKSGIAKAREQLVAEGLLRQTNDKYRLGPAGLLNDRLVSGYAQVLRPKLTLGTFRPIEKTASAFLTRLREHKLAGIRYSVTGGQAAKLLQHYYQGPEVTLFVDPATREAIRELRLLPDRQGPVTILKAFGEVVFGDKREQHLLAPPWLVYAELLNSRDSRAHEAAGEFRRGLLPDATSE